MVIDINAFEREYRSNVNTCKCMQLQNFFDIFFKLLLSMSCKPENKHKSAMIVVVIAAAWCGIYLLLI